MPRPPAFPIWPEDRRSGDVAVDALLDAVIEGDLGRFAAAMEYFPLPCVPPRPVTGRPPFCAPNEPTGTVVHWWLLVGTEEFLFRQDEPAPSEILENLMLFRPRLVAVYEQDLNLPPARLVVLLAPTLQYERSGSDDGCPAVVRFAVNTRGFTGSLGCAPPAILLPPGVRYLVPVRSE